MASFGLASELDEPPQGGLQSSKHGRPAAASAGKTEAVDLGRFASRIQATYRGHAVRKSMESEGILPTKHAPRSQDAKKMDTGIRAHYGPASSSVTAHQERGMLSTGRSRQLDTPSSTSRVGSQPSHASSGGKALSKQPAAEEEYYATKIQSAYRGHAVRRSLSSSPESVKQPGPSRSTRQPQQPISLSKQSAADAAVPGSRGSRPGPVTGTPLDQKYAPQQRTSPHKPAATSPSVRSSQSEEDWYATKIQSAYRGHAARRSLEKVPSAKPGAADVGQKPTVLQAELTPGASPRANQARAEQSKPHRSTQPTARQPGGSAKPEGHASPSRSTRSSYGSEDWAAEKIQAAFRGHSVRKTVGSPTRNATRSTPASATKSRQQPAYSRTAASGAEPHLRQPAGRPGQADVRGGFGLDSELSDGPSPRNAAGSRAHRAAGGFGLDSEFSEKEVYSESAHSVRLGSRPAASHGSDRFGRPASAQHPSGARPASAVASQHAPAGRGGRPGRHGHAPFSEEDSARRIQAVYRGHAVRKTLQQDPHRQLSSSRTPLAAGTRTAGTECPSTAVASHSHSTASKVTRSARSQGELSEEDSARRIQAVYRGHAVRRSLEQDKLQHMTRSSSSNRRPVSGGRPAASAGGGSQRDSSGRLVRPAQHGHPELSEEDSARRIQAIYRGHAVRKSLEQEGVQLAGGRRPGSSGQAGYRAQHAQHGPDMDALAREQREALLERQSTSRVAAHVPGSPSHHGQGPPATRGDHTWDQDEPAGRPSPYEAAAGRQQSPAGDRYSAVTYDGNSRPGKGGSPHAVAMNGLADEHFGLAADLGTDEEYGLGAEVHRDDRAGAARSAQQAHRGHAAALTGPSRPQASIQHRAEPQTTADPKREEARLIHEWERFAERQADRFAPLSVPISQRRMLAESQGHRVRLLALSGVPMYQAEGRTFEFRVGVTLFDKGSGQFFGNTCISTPVPFDKRKAGSRQGVRCNLSFDLYFHSRLVDSQCMAVVDVVLVERLEDGVIDGEYSAGWAMLPLLPPPLKSPQKKAVERTAGVMMGTPRYLLFQGMFLDQAIPAQPLVSEAAPCLLTYTVEPYPAATAFAALVPEDFLITYSDVVPGLQRFNPKGQSTVALVNISSTLASPLLVPTFSIVLHSVRIALPHGFGETLEVLLTGSSAAQHSATEPTARGPPLEAYGDCFAVRLGVHNGRTFVGDPVVTHGVTLQPRLLAKGKYGLSMEVEELLLDCLPADVLTCITLELLYIGPLASDRAKAAAAANSRRGAKAGPAARGGSAQSRHSRDPSPEPYEPEEHHEVVLAWAPMMPFVQETLVNPQAAALKEGQHDLKLRSGPGRWPRPQPVLNWRGLMEQSGFLNPSAPSVSFCLEPSGQPSAPPTRPTTPRMQQAGQHLEWDDEQPADAAQKGSQHDAPPVGQHKMRRQSVQRLSVQLPHMHSIMEQHAKQHAGPPHPRKQQVQHAPQHAGTPHPRKQQQWQDQEDAEEGEEEDQRKDEQGVRPPSTPHPRKQHLPPHSGTPHPRKQQAQQQRSRTPQSRQPHVWDLDDPHAAPDAADDDEGDDESAAAPADHQLARLAADIQRQLDQLSRAVTNLHKGRASLQSFGEEPEHRHSLHGRDHNRSGFEDDPDPFAPANGHASEAGRLMHLTHLRAMAPTAAHGDERLFSGAPEAVLKQPHSPTRAMRARLVEAGATDSLPSGVNDLLRQQRQAASPPERLVLGLEIADPRTVNDVIIQLLAYKPQDAVNAPTTLRSMYFTLQFYDCPPTSTEPAALAPAYGHDDTLILKPHEKHNGDDAPAGAGVVLKFRVDPVGDGEDMSAGGMEDRLVHFCRYLATRSLSIDVWDGDSLLQVGSMSVDLRGLLRQGREFSESLLELPVYDLQDPVASSAAPHTAAAAAGPSTAAPDMLPRGLLVMRLINIGQKSDLAASVMAANVASRSGDRDRGTPGRTKRVRVRAATHTNSVLARELTGVDPNILAQMAAARSPSLSPGSPAHTLSHSPLQASLAQHSMRQQILEVAQRKVVRAERLRELQQASASVAGDRHSAAAASRRHPAGSGTSPGSRSAASPSQAGLNLSNGDRERLLRQQTLADIEHARSRHKADAIRQQLRDAMSSHCIVRPAYGETVMFEHEFTNPLLTEAVYQLQISHPQELAVVTDPQEWRALQAMQPAGTIRGRPLEDAVLDGDRLYLAAGETLAIPFRLRNLRHTGSGAEASLPGTPGSAMSGGSGMSGGSSPATWRTVTAELLTLADQRPVAVLQVDVRPKPLVIDRTLRLAHVEHEVLHQALPVLQPPAQVQRIAEPGWEQPAASSSAQGPLGALCSHPDVIVLCDNSSQRPRSPHGLSPAGRAGSASKAGKDAVLIKFKCGGAPETSQFYLVLYRDAFRLQPVAVWLVYVHALRRVDLTGMVGQSSQSSVVVRGRPASATRVACFSSHPDELQVAPAEFTLPAGGLAELLLSFRPLHPGSLRATVHVVDMEARQLVHALLVVTESQAPPISRAFGVDLPAGGHSAKRITFTNPFSQRRTFYLRSSLSALLRVAPGQLDMAPHETKSVGMTFDTTKTAAGQYDVLVFVNDAADKNVECFKVRVSVV